MKNTYQNGAVGLIVLILILLAGGIGFYFYNTDRVDDAKEGVMVEDESSEVNEMNDAEDMGGSDEPVGFEEDPGSLPSVTTDGSTGVQGAPVNPNIPVYTPEPVLAATIGMKNFAFVPKTVTIKVGEAVEWVNDDYTNHTVTSNVTGSFDSGNLASGNNYVRTFTEPGTYTYYCKWHPNMTGIVIVE